MQIFISLDTGSLALNVDSSTLVASVKAAVEDREGFPSSQQRLSFCGKQLDDSSSLAECGVTSDATLRLSFGLCGGGKVHGSLARAGKVKNQTPKVQKSEEKKAKVPRGRAHKRELYIRRHVNAKTGPGRKVGPNNNAARLEREEEQRAKKEEQEIGRAHV